MNNIFNIIKNKLYYKSQNCDKIYFTYQAYIILFLLGLIIIFLRSAYNIITPSMYTEDGTWLGVIINDGFWNAFVSVKSTYFVSANMIGLYVAFILNKIFFGYNISNLPLFITLVQYILYSLVALLPVIVFRKHFNKIFLIFVWLSILILPLGNSSYEIFGKISNIGYLFYFIAFCFLFYRIENREKLTILQIIFIDFILLICCTTNPVCYILLLLGGLIDIYMQRQVLMPSKTNISIGNTIKIFLQKFSNKSWIILGFLCLINILYHMFFQNSVIIDMPKDKSIHWMAYLLRISFYPLIYPFYDKLNDTKSGILLGIIVVYFSFIYIKSNKQDRKIFTIILLVFLLHAFITTYARPIMAVLYSYINTAPDRYVYSLNIQFMILFFYATNLLFKNGMISKNITVIILFLYILMNILNINTIIQFYENINKTTHQVTFSQRISNTFEKYGISDLNSIVRIDIDFPGFYMNVPGKYILCSYYGINDIPPYFTLANVTDNNWINGLSKANNQIFLVEKKSYKIIEYTDEITLYNNYLYRTNVIEKKDAGPYIHILTDTNNPEKFAYPAKLKYNFKYIPSVISAVDYNDANYSHGLNITNKSIILIDKNYNHILNKISKIKININKKSYETKIVAIENVPYKNFLKITTDIPDASMFAYPAKIEYELK